MARPYQPSLLRLLHGTTALLVPLAWLSGFVVYNRHDGRWGRLPLPAGGDWIDIHGTFGVLLWPVALLFVLYALSLGRRHLHRPANAVALLGLALAVGSGKLMNETWLRDGKLHHTVYALHLFAWLAIAAAVLAHVGSVLGRGGLPLARSMFHLAARPDDRPRHWPRQVRRFFAKQP
jgi:hypothetical protein